MNDVSIVGGSAICHAFLSSHIKARISTANCSPTLLPTKTLSVVIGLIELARECQYAKHGGLVLSIPYRSWSTGLSDQRLVGLTSASLVVWHRSSSPTLDYCFKYRTEVYRPFRKSTVPIIDRDTNPYRFHLSINFTDLPTLVSGPENSTTVRGADAQPRYVLPSIQPYTRRVCCITIRTACHAT